VKHPSYCCQNCGDFIGWMGQFMFPFFHKCRNKTTKHMTEYTTQTTSIKFDKNFVNPAVLIHHDGRVTIGDDLKPDEAAKKMFKIFKDLWANDAQAVKIRDLELRILKLKTAGTDDVEHGVAVVREMKERISKLNDYVAALETAGDEMANELSYGYDVDMWNKAKEAKP